MSVTRELHANLSGTPCFAVSFRFYAWFSDKYLYKPHLKFIPLLVTIKLKIYNPCNVRRKMNLLYLE